MLFAASWSLDPASMLIGGLLVVIFGLVLYTILKTPLE